ncbi:MAG: YggT family protein [Rhodothalassiaceae bacterium]
MMALIMLIDSVLAIFSTIVIVWAIMSWLVAFNVINTHNRFVAIVMDFLYRITEPPLRPIRRILPDFGGIDISPIVLLLLILFLRNLLRYDIMPALG